MLGIKVKINKDQEEVNYDGLFIYYHSEIDCGIKEKHYPEYLSGLSDVGGSVDPSSLIGGRFFFI